MRAYKDSDLREAKQYLLSRLDAEQKMSAYLDEALTSAAKKIIAISLSYNIPPSQFRFSTNASLKKEVEAVIALLRDALYDKCQELLSFRDDEDDAESVFLPTCLTGKSYRKTLKERIAIYSRRFGYEVEAVIAGAMLAGERAERAILSSMESSLHSPWSNVYFLQYKGAGEAVRLREEGVHYGSGRSNSAANALLLALGVAVGMGYMENWFRIGKARGAIGFYTFRNSSYACGVCDEKATVFHYISDSMPPFHVRCVCGVVFVYDK